MHELIRISISTLLVFLGLILPAITITLKSTNHGSYTGVMIVPTGIASTIGGYAGDALPSCKLLAAVCDTLITHPNVMNGAMLYDQIPNVQYVEGYALDEFANGNIGLLPRTKKGNRIGLLLDKGMEDHLRIRHMHVADAFRATLGIDIASCVVTSEPVGVEVALSASGASWGSLKNIDTLLHGAQELINDGCTAIAVVVRFPEDESEEEQLLFEKYRKGEGVDAIAGAEALISHIITQKFCLPCAHAPAFDALDPGRLLNVLYCMVY
jgi:hypothetical protein